MTTLGVSEAYLDEISKAVACHYGLNFPKDRWGDLARAMVRAASELGFEDPHSLAKWILQSPFQESRIDAFVGYITIGETHFFRDEKLFRLLESEILPELIASRASNGRWIRIWSAGCATGEEPYSVAIVLSKLIEDMSSWNVTILATDINTRFLEKAKQGVYSSWSFRSVSPRFIDRYFVQVSQSSEILPEFRKMVSFERLNLAKDAFPLLANNTFAMDVIFCRNVLMYFTESFQQHVVEKLCDCLVDGGSLIVTPAEAAIIRHPQLVQECRGGAIIFRKIPKRAVLQEKNPFIWELTLPAMTHPEPVTAWQPAALSPDLTSTSEPVVSPPPSPPATPDAEMDTLNSCEGKSNTYRDALQYYESGQYLEVVDRLTTVLADPALDLGERCASMTLLCKAYANLGDLSSALEWSEKTVSMDKLNARSHYFHGSLLQELGRLQEAVVSMNKAVFLDPDLVVAHFALGNIFRQLGKPKESERHFRTALVILSAQDEHDVVPASDGLTAGRLTEIIVSTSRKEGTHARRRNSHGSA